MNLIEFQQEAKRTNRIFDTLEVNLAHMVLGVFSEINELQKAIVDNDAIGQGEEIADQFWYLANYCTFRNYSLNELWENRRDFIDECPEVDGLIFYMSRLQNFTKKFLVYGKPIDQEKEINALKGYLFWLDEVTSEIRDFDLERVLQNNIDKLRKRFPDKFEGSLAINKDVAAERVELEK